MLTSIKAVWITVVVGLLIAGAPFTPQIAADSGNLTGAYWRDARPTELFYLSLTQSGSSVSGYAVIVEPTTDPEVADVLTSRSLNVEGTATETSVTLVLGDWASGQMTMTGSKQDDALILTYPTISGEIGTAIFQSTSQHAFNQTVSEWRAGLAAENELWALMPGDWLMPQGITYASGDSLSKESVANPYPEVAIERLSEWEWTAAIKGAFMNLEGPLPPGRTDTIMVSLIRFGSPEAASEALVRLSQSSRHDDYREREIETIGDQSHVLASVAPIEDLSGIRNEAMVYLRTDATVIIIFGRSPEGDPAPVLVELAKQMVDPVYAATQAQNTQDMIDLSTQLDDQIAGMYDAAGWFNGQVEDARLDLDDVQAAVDTMESDLDNMRAEAAVRPMTCIQSGVVDIEYEVLKIDEGSLDIEREAFDSTVANLEAELDAVEESVTSIQATARTLKESIEASAYPPPALNAHPGDEEAAIAAYEQAAETARLDLESLRNDYNDVLTRADEIINEGATIVEDVHALSNCQ